MPHVFTAVDDPVPDVWLQLLERCAAESGCQPTILRTLAQQLEEQRALTTQLRQQVSDQQQQMVGLQGQLQELRATMQQVLLLHQQ